MKRLPLLLLCICGLLSSGKLFGENISVSGKVFDENNNALTSAIVALKKTSDSSLVKILFTGNDGEYQFENVPEGWYFIEVTMPGHAPAFRKFAVEEGDHKEIKSFMLDPASKNEAIHPMLIVLSGKTVLDLEGSGTKVTGTAFDVVKAMPQMMVNEDGVLFCSGKSQLGLEIDGRKTGLTGYAMRNRLREINAEGIAGISVENGSPAVINIITCEGVKNGFYGKVSAGADYGKNFRTEDAFEFNYHQGKFDFFGGYDYSDKKMQEQTLLSSSYIYSGMDIDFNSQSIAVQKPVDHEANAGFNYTGNKGLTFGAEFTKENTRDAGTQKDKSIYNFPAFDTALVFEQSYTSLTNDKIRSVDFHADQIVKRTGSKYSSSLRVAEDHSSWNQSFPLTEGEEATTDFYRYAGGNDLRYATATLKYAQAWNSKLITVAGVKKTIVTSKSDFGIQHLVSENWIDEGLMSQSYHSQQQINSAFLIAYLEAGKFEFAFAVDAQQSSVSGISTASETITNSGKVQFLPSLSIDQQVNKNNAINYSFSQDIKRPSFRDLDPTSRYVNRYTYETGNPDLRPQLNNEAKIEWTFLGLFSVSGGVDFTNNGIQQVSRVDSNGVLFRTKENITKEKNATIEVFCPLPIGKNIILQNKLEYTWSAFQSEVYGMSINNKNQHFTGISIMQISLPSEFKVNVSGYFVSPVSNGIISMKSTGAMNLSVSKTMLNKKLEVEVGVTDILNTGNTRATILTQDGVVNYHSKSETQTITLKASYSFGNEKAARKEK
ncbi:outer membrane beta-barrel family protein [soil metagenome]